MEIIINTQKTYKMCPVCGRLYTEEYNYCPKCDNNNKLPQVKFE